MKIVFCDNSIKSLINFRGDVIEHFVQMGHDVVLVAPIVNDDDAATVIPTGCKFIDIKMMPSSMNPKYDIKLIKEYYKIYKLEKPDLVFNYTIKPNIYSSVIAKLQGAKVVDMLAGLGYIFSNKKNILKIGRWMYKIGLYCADKVIILNNVNADTIIRNGFAKEEKIIVFESGEGVNLEVYKYSENSFLESTTFLMVARILYDKGYSEFVDAAKIVKKKFPNANFELLGAMDVGSPMGVQYKDLQTDIDSGCIRYLGKTYNVCPFVSRKGVVVTLPSYHEGMSRSLMEGCAMGRPLISTDIPGCREIVDDGVNGFLCKPKDSESLADAMIKFLELSEDKKLQMCNASHQKAVDCFDVKKVFKYYDDIVNELTRRS